MYWVSKAYLGYHGTTFIYKGNAAGSAVATCAFRLRVRRSQSEFSLKRMRHFRSPMQKYYCEAAVVLNPDSEIRHAHAVLKAAFPVLAVERCVVDLTGVCHAGFRRRVRVKLFRSGDGLAAAHKEKLWEFLDICLNDCRQVGAGQ